ncbi:hypothetical protein F4861DRAFT_550294 [Xylaria intraflava]|nr:hypothetical protein F4861DRAFT_550294 [Xylaria intraflava]
MGRARRGGRRSRANRNNNSNSNPDRINNSPRVLDREDDLLMYDVEDDRFPSNPPRRKRRNNIRGSSTNYGHFSSLMENPFRHTNSGTSTFQEPQGPRFPQERNRNRGRKHGYQAHNDSNNYAVNRQTGRRPGRKHEARRRGGPSPVPETDDANNNNNRNHSHNHDHDHNYNHNNNRNRNHSNDNNHSHHQDAFAPIIAPPNPAGRIRFCTECSAVRRANLALRDWLLAATAHATQIIDGWSDEVGVGRGSADEMDWQPEPVIRVLILTARADAEGGFRWEQGQQGCFGGFTGDAFGAGGSRGSQGDWAGYRNEGIACGWPAGSTQDGNYGTMGLGLGILDVSPLGSRPNSTSPRPAAGGWGSGGLGIAGVSESGNVSSVLGVDDGGQGRINAGGALGDADHDQLPVGMVSPPDSPRSLLNAHP